MKSKNKFLSFPLCHPFSAVCTVAVVLLFGVLAASAQIGDYMYKGSEQTITLNPGRYDIIAYGAQGGADYQSGGAYGAEMEGEFDFTTVTTLTLLVGGVGGYGGGGQFGSGGGGGGGSFVVNGSTPLVVAGGGGGAGASGSSPGVTGTSGTPGNVNAFGGAGGAGGVNGGGGQYYVGGGGGGFSGGGGGINGRSFLSGGGGGGNGGFGGGGGGSYTQAGGGGGVGKYNPDYGLGGGGGGSIIDSSAIMVPAEVSGVASPDGSPNGEIMIAAVPEQSYTLALAAISVFPLLLIHMRLARTGRTRPRA
jgi:hypothetical protein